MIRNELATMTAGMQKIWHPDPRIGFLAQATQLREKAPALEQQLSAAKASGDAQVIAATEKALRTNLTLRFNQRLDAFVAGTFLVLITIILLMSIREWVLLLARKKIAELRETPPTWLPDYAIAESKPVNLGSLLALTLALAKELSGEAHLERAQQAQLCCCAHSEENHAAKKSAESVYVEATEQRFNGIRRCC